MMTASEDRTYWSNLARRLLEPVLTALANDRLRATMPVEQPEPEKNNRIPCTHLEAFGRNMAGLSAWLQSEEDDAGRAELAILAQKSLVVATSPSSRDFLNFCGHPEGLVDSAFLAQGILRAPKLLWEGLDDRTRKNVVEAMKSTRVIKPSSTNWLLFSATVEAFLAMAGEQWDRLRVQYALFQHEQWYKGDGTYGDGAHFRWDYYNSFVIQPMLIDVLGAVAKYQPEFAALTDRVQRRAQRMVVVLERLVAADGTYPPMGRSIVYRCGAFQLLAQLALQEQLPERIKPAQVRGALTAVLRQTLDAPNTFDDKGWLRIGLHGHQPRLGESYISTGSLYLCAVGLLPLGLPRTAGFWADPSTPFTAQRIWRGEDIDRDHALVD